MVENSAIARLAGTEEERERWRAGEVSFELRLAWWDVLSARAVIGLGGLAIAAFVGTQIAVPGFITGMMMLALVIGTIGGGVLLPLSLLAWVLRPATVRITDGELIVHGLAFSRDRVRTCALRGGRVVVEMRDGRSWESRRFTARSPSRLNALLESVPHADAVPERNRQEAVEVQRLLAFVQD